ncbi:Glutathione S-transferase U8 [Linum perenne]
MEGVKLLGFWASTFSNRVELALKLKGVDYEYIEQDLANKSPLLLELNPVHKKIPVLNPVHKKIPVLVHNGKSIAESLVILEYIDETWPNNYPILPHDPYEKAMARFWAKFIDDKCLEGAWKIVWCAEEERRKMMEEVTQQLKALEEQLKGKKFFGGERIGIVDIAASFFGFWLGLIQEVTGLELVTKHKFPVLCN